MNGIARSSTMAYVYSSHSDSGSLSFLWVRDPRAELFLETFVFWLDTVEMIRVAGVQEVYNSNWAFPIYILSFFSILRVVVTPNNPMLASLGVVAQDLPFLVLRICLVTIFGYVTPILYIMKNLLTCLTFLYFHFLTKLKVFNRGSLFWDLWRGSYWLPLWVKKCMGWILTTTSSIEHTLFSLMLLQRRQTNNRSPHSCFFFFLFFLKICLPWFISESLGWLISYWKCMWEKCFTGAIRHSIVSSNVSDFQSDHPTHMKFHSSYNLYN